MLFFLFSSSFSNCEYARVNRAIRVCMYSALDYWWTFNWEISYSRSGDHPLDKFHVVWPLQLLILLFHRLFFFFFFAYHFVLKFFFTPYLFSSSIFFLKLSCCTFHSYHTLPLVACRRVLAMPLKKSDPTLLRLLRFLVPLTLPPSLYFIYI